MITNQQIINQINKKIEKTPLFYLTPHQERGTGLENLLQNYQIISPFQSKNTTEILEKSVLPENSFILVFKNNVRIQRICQEKKIKLLNPDFRLTEKFENKSKQYQWLKTFIPERLPLTIITTPEETSFKDLIGKLGKRFIIQFNHSHSGEGTFLLSRKKQWKKIRKKFLEREIKCTEFIKNPCFTLNACIWRNCVLVNFPSFQITGLKRLTDLPFSTVGNDWSLSQKIFKEKDWLIIKEISQKIGKNMAHQGWQGLFGVDFIKKNQQWLVIEINARQPASTSMETILQRKQGQGLTTLAIHLAALLKISLPDKCAWIQESLQKVFQGSQVIFRQKEKKNIKIKEEVEGDSFRLIKNNLKNKKHNDELYRLQNFNQSLVLKYNQLSDLRSN